MNGKKAKKLRKQYNASDVRMIHGRPPVFEVNDAMYSVKRVMAGVPTVLDPKCGRAKYQKAKRAA